MTGPRIIGIGSPLGADQAGWAVVAAMAERAPGAAVYERLDRPGADLVARLEMGGDLVLVDAMRAGLVAGEVRELATDELAGGGPLLSSHGFGVAEALALAESLGALPPGLRVFGVEVADLDEWPEALTAAAADRVLDRLRL